MTNLISESIYNGGVCRTAPTQLGLFKRDGVAPLIADPPPLKLHQKKIHPFSKINIALQPAMRLGDTSRFRFPLKKLQYFMNESNISNPSVNYIINY